MASDLADKIRIGLTSCRSPVKEALQRYFVAVNQPAGDGKLAGIIDCFEKEAEVIIACGTPLAPGKFYDSSKSPVLSKGFRAEPDWSTLVCGEDGRTAVIAIKLVPGGNEERAYIVADWFTTGATGRLSRLLIHGSPSNPPPAQRKEVVLGSAKPYMYSFKIPSTALVMIDFQRDFLLPGGFGASLGNDVSHLQSAVGPAKAALGMARHHGIKVVHTREGHRPDLSDLVPAKKRRGNPPEGGRIGDKATMGRILVDGELGCSIVPELQPVAGELDLLKPGKGAFWNTGLEAWLQENGVSHLLITGVTTEVCVQTTMREANDRGFECCLLKDATASYFPQFYESTLEMITAQGGIVGWTATTTELGEALKAAL
eukprot:gnl/MRDRNA2_/MRDRNA2_98253_c0_seq1.p1 gnl/MRDRNA2_/MRDRNA2_98253_c0~~gnl/MRDRNA2_/MRDRNA2_98253_c0_seq1.p1  ORF type:complete len:382 (-),score=73.77 gnl/MRDRNA2_/MRDRNA2_98253_c0_seq1:59-1174(-)